MLGAMEKGKEEVKIYKEVIIGKNQFMLTWMRM